MPESKSATSEVKYGVFLEKRQDMWRRRRRRDGGMRYGIKRPGLFDLTGLQTNKQYSISVSSPYSPYTYPLFEQPPIHSTILKYWSLHSLHTAASLCVIIQGCQCKSLYSISTIFCVPPLCFWCYDALIIDWRYCKVDVQTVTARS